jgi:hypothetical protein
MAFWSLHGFGEVFLDVANGEQWSSYEVAGFYSFEPGGLDGVSAHGVHPFDGVLGGWQVVNTVVLLQDVACFLGWVPWLPVPLVLHERDLVASMLVSGANEEGLASASENYVLFLVDGDACVREDGDSAVITGFANSHEGLWEIVERVGEGSVR